MHEPTGSAGVMHIRWPRIACSTVTPHCAAYRDIFRRAALAGLIGLTAFSLLGCTTTYREFIAFQEGWRTAEVFEVGAADTLQRRGLTDCRTSATADELQTRQFASVGYRMAGRPHVHIVILDTDSLVRRGDYLTLNVLQCGGAMALMKGPPGSSLSPQPDHTARPRAV